MHWGGRFMHGGGINALTLAAFDPVSKQPELKHAAVQVEKLDYGWQVIAIRSGDASRYLDAVRPLLDRFPYATCGLSGRDVPLLVFRAAADAPVAEDLIAELDALLELEDDSCAMDYRDPRRGVSKRVLMQDGKLVGARLTGETAARDWLTEINRINSEARDATVEAGREHAAAMEIGATLERLGLAADAARIGAENADAVCLAARAAVADCVEQANTPPSTFPIQPISNAAPGVPRLDDDETLGLALEAGGEPRIFRLLRGDRQAMTSLVAALAGDDPEARRRWQLQLTDLVEAIVADAIEASALEFPAGHPFWGEFTGPQGRDVVEALSSLGYRFDGLGGWTDARHPSQRDLSLALGYAGLDPKRVRPWPTEEAVTALFADVTVAADEYLAGTAGDLTLAEMVAMLGRRADGLAEIWNQWGRVRPLLLDES